MSMAGPIERRREHLLRQRHADGVREALPERTGRGLDAQVQVVLGMAGGVRAELTERLQVVDRQRIAGEMQQRVQQHRAVAVRDHEAVAVGPLRIAGIVLEMIVPQHFGDVGHAHRHAGMAGVGLLHRIHRQGANGVGKLPAARCLHREAIPGSRARFWAGRAEARAHFGPAHFGPWGAVGQCTLPARRDRPRNRRRAASRRCGTVATHGDDSRQ